MGEVYTTTSKPVYNKATGKTTFRFSQSSKKPKPSGAVNLGKPKTFHHTSGRTGKTVTVHTGGFSYGSGWASDSSQPKPQIKTIDPVIEIEQSKPTSPSQQKIKSLNNENLKSIDSFQANTPLGKKLGFETTRSLFEKGAFGSALKLEEQATQPFTDRGFDVAQGVKKLGLGIASIPAEAGQIAGGAIAKQFGYNTGFKEDTPFIYTSAGSGEQGVREIFSGEKALAETQQRFQTDPFGTSIDIGVKTLGLIPLFTGGAKLFTRGATKIGSKFATLVPSEKIVKPNVLSGVERFPTAKSVTQAQKTFAKTKFNIIDNQKVVFHATTQGQIPIIGRKTLVSAGRGIDKAEDVPGLFTSTDGVSTHFLRLKKGIHIESGLPSKIFPKIIPDAPQIRAIREIPQAIPSQFTTSFGKAQSFFGKVPGATKVQKVIAPKGTPFFSPSLTFGIKKEAEAVIGVGSKLKRVGLETIPQKIMGFSKFTKINGRTIPIFEEVAVKTTKTTVKPITKIMNQIIPRTFATSSSSVPSSGSALLSSSNIVTGATIAKIINNQPKPKPKVSSTTSKRSGLSYFGFNGFSLYDPSKIDSRQSIGSSPITSSGKIGSSSIDSSGGSSSSPSSGLSGGSSSGGSSGGGSSSSSIISPSSSRPSSSVSSSTPSRTPPILLPPTKKPEYKFLKTKPTKKYNQKKFKLLNETKLNKFWNNKKHRLF